MKPIIEAIFTRIEKLALTAGMITCSWAASAAAPPSYVARDLGVLNEGFSLADAVSSDGIATGFAGISNARFSLTHRAFRSTGRAKLSALNGPKIVASFGLGINAKHMVVGLAETQDRAGNTTQYAFAASMDGPIALFGGPASQANAVNDSGQAVGSLLSGGTYHAISWTQAGGVTDLGTYGGTSAAALAVNAGGDLLVNISTRQSDGIPVLVRGGKPMRILIPGALEAFGEAINTRADVVGYSVPTGQGGTPENAFAYSHGQVIGLPHLAASSTQSVPYGINTTGQIVGGDSTASGAVTGVMWDLATQTPVDLNTRIDAASGIRIDVAYAINDRGTIVGVGVVPGDTQEHAILLQPR